MKDYDVVVVGGGAAGLSAALVLARARRTVAVVDAGARRSAPAAHMHGFLSRDGMPPHDLLAAGRAEVAGYGGRLIDDTVVGVEPGFHVRLASASRLRARRILIATGLRDELPDLPGVRERWGRDLLHCPYCHGYEVRDQPLGVLGGAPEAVQHALLVRQWSPDVVLFPHTDTLVPEQHEQLQARGIQIADGTVARLVVGNDQLQGVELRDGRVVARTAVFVRPRFVPNADLLTGLGCELDELGWVVHDPAGRTSVAGVYHRLEQRIRAHVLLCWLALLLVHVAERQTGATWRRLVGELGRLHLVTLAGPEGRAQHTTRLTDPQRAIYQTLKVAPPPPVTTLDPA